MTERTLLIDADVIAYTAASSVEKEFDWGDDLWTLHSDVGEARRAARDAIDGLCENLKADHVVLAFSDKGNFRKAIYPDYKSNRKGKRRPIALAELKLWLSDEFETITMPALEGDDVLGIIATHPDLYRGEKIIVSIDKDLRTIPGWYFSPLKDTQPQWITEDEADYWHMMQTLMGDATDGYPGCPSIGPKTAEKLLEGVPSENRWDAVVAAYAKKGLTEADALVQARCARILRYSDYDYDQKGPILWLPAQ
jgi:DNA polymerase-1